MPTAEKEELVEAERPWYSFDPDYLHPPGETLRQTLDAIGMSQADFARRAGLSTKHVNQIIQGDAAITPETAVALELVTGVPVDTWLALELRYQARLRRLGNGQALDEDDRKWVASMPIRELTKRGLLPETKDVAARFRHLLRFFRVASRSAWATVWLDPDATFRRSQAFVAKPEATAAWLRIAEIKAGTIDCAPFDRTKLRDAINLIHRGAAKPITPSLIEEITATLAAAGVAFVLVREIEGSRASGVTRWVSATRAYIALSLRYRRDDHFWFTLFHELAHVLLHGKRQMFVEFSDGKRDGAGDVAEAEADRFAADMLIPRSYLSRLRTLISPTPTDIVLLARDIGVSPGVVVGRMQREGLLPWSAFPSLREPIDYDAMAAVAADPVLESLT